jgi:pimeloyl-ACP methyl ester carboxylesterase
MAAFVYLHGQPGGPGEWLACAPAGMAAITPDRNTAPGLAALAAQIGAAAGPGPITLIGFSLGAPVALALAAALGGRVAQLHLVSPAAPLALGDFLPTMAGGALFRLARDRPALFRLPARLEGLAARTAPGLLFDRLFATASGDDVHLRRDPAFRAAMAAVLRDGLGRDPAGFIAEVTAYAAGTAPADGAIAAPIHIWQGGDDSWTPPAMAQALAASLPGDVTLTHLPGCGHYGALRAALAQIHAQSPA